jgi:hypothetical protein
MTNWNLLHTTQSALNHWRMLQAEAVKTRTLTRLLEADRRIQQTLVSAQAKTLRARWALLFRQLRSWWNRHPGPKEVRERALPTERT